MTAEGTVQTLIVEGLLAAVWLRAKELLVLQFFHPVPKREAESTVPSRVRQILQERMTEQ